MVETSKSRGKTGHPDLEAPKSAIGLNPKGFLWDTL